MTPNQNPILSANARSSALAALSHTLEKLKPLDSAWAADRHFATLSPSDRAFAQLLAKTTLRRLGQVDAILAKFLDRPLAARSARAMHVLRLGVVQLVWLDTPPHAAVHSMVELTKQIKLDSFSGLVNAVLKRVSQEGRAIAAQQDAPRLNTPDWLWEKWMKAYGEQTARQIAEAHLNDPPLDITVKDNAPHWAAELGGIVLPTGSVRLREARGIPQMPGFADGRWWVQDMAATIPARVMGDVTGKRVIDLCAAPGGKTAQLAAGGARVSAVDVSKERIAMLKTNVHRLKLQAEYVTTDAAQWQPGFAPDAILLDAPCSATGTLRRHPDVAWLRQPQDIARLQATQARLLRHALDIVRPGGLLVYAVCSLQPEEGEKQIEALLAERPDAVMDVIKPGVIGLPEECGTPRGEIRTLPCHLSELGGMDGFFVARLHKKEG